MKKIYQTPEIVVTKVVSESIIASSVGAGFQEGQQSGSTGGRAINETRGNDWENMWNN